MFVQQPERGQAIPFASSAPNADQEMEDVIRSGEERFDSPNGLLRFLEAQQSVGAVETIDWKCVREPCDFVRLSKVMEGLGESRLDLVEGWSQDPEFLQEVEDRLPWAFAADPFTTFKAFYETPSPDSKTAFGDFLRQYWVAWMQEVPPLEKSQRERRKREGFFGTAYEREFPRSSDERGAMEGGSSYAMRERRVFALREWTSWEWTPGPAVPDGLITSPDAQDTLEMWARWLGRYYDMAEFLLAKRALSTAENASKLERGLFGVCGREGGLVGLDEDDCPLVERRPFGAEDGELQMLRAGLLRGVKASAALWYYLLLVSSVTTPEDDPRYYPKIEAKAEKGGPGGGPGAAEPEPPGGRGERLEDHFVVPAEKLAVTVQANFLVRQRLPRKDSSSDAATGPDFHSKIIAEHDHVLTSRTLEDDFKTHAKDQAQVWETWRKGSLLGARAHRGPVDPDDSSKIESAEHYEEVRWKGDGFQPPSQKTLDGTTTMYSWYNPATVPQITAWAFSGLSNNGFRETDVELYNKGRARQSTNHLEKTTSFQRMDESVFALRTTPLFLAMRTFGLFADDYRDYWSPSADPRNDPTAGGPGGGTDSQELEEKHRVEIKDNHLLFEDRDMDEWFLSKKTVHHMYVLAGFEVSLPSTKKLKLSSSAFSQKDDEFDKYTVEYESRSDGSWESMNALNNHARWYRGEANPDGMDAVIRDAGSFYQDKKNHYSSFLPVNTAPPGGPSGHLLKTLKDEILQLAERMTTDASKKTVYDDRSLHLGVTCLDIIAKLHGATRESGDDIQADQYLKLLVQDWKKAQGPGGEPASAESSPSGTSALEERSRLCGLLEHQDERIELLLDYYQRSNEPLDHFAAELILLQPLDVLIPQIIREPRKMASRVIGQIAKWADASMLLL